MPARTMGLLARSLKLAAGETGRKSISFPPGVPPWTYVSDIFTSPREASTVVRGGSTTGSAGDYIRYLR